VKHLRGKICFSFWLLILAMAALSACQGTINYPAPTIKSLSPNNIAAGQPPFTLTVTGSNLTPASVIEWNGEPLISIFQTQNTMTAQISPGLIQNPGTVQVTVFTPQPGGGIAQPALDFVINPTTSPIPTISYINPSSVLAGGNPPQIYVYGQNFESLTTLAVNGFNISTSVINSTTLTATLSTSNVAASGTLQIIVSNPPPGGGSSNPVTLSVTNPVPSITSVTPTSIPAATTATPTTLTVAGKSFVPNSTITINGVARLTSFAGSASLSANLTSADISVGGINLVEVVNPAPGGGTSNMLSYSVNPTTSVGLPVLVDLGPNGIIANAGVCGASCTGVDPTLTLLTAGPSLSSNGESVAFASVSNNLILDQTSPATEVYLRTTCLTLGATCTPTTSIVSRTSAGGISNGPSWEPSLDSSAAHVTFTSLATNLVTTATVPGGTTQVYWTPVCTGTVTCTGTNGPSTTLVSLGADGITPGNGDSYNSAISPDGQYVAFVSVATNLVADVVFDGVTPQVYIRSTCGGVTSTTCVPTTYLVSTPDVTLPFATPGNGASTNPAISNDGLYVSFTSSASNLGATAPNPGGAQEVFDRTTCVTTISESTNTCAPITTLISTPDGTTPANALSADSAISNDGRFIAFASMGTNLGVASGGVQQVFVRDTCISTDTITCPAPSTILVSTTDGTTPANGLSEHPSISRCGGTGTCATGQFIAFASLANNLGFNISNGIENVFVRNTCLVFTTTTTTCTASTTLASQPAGTTPLPSNGSSLMPSISGDGHSVSFLSLANNLVPYPSSGFQDVYLATTGF
jgi:hypothetical protein